MRKLLLLLVCVVSYVSFAQTTAPLVGGSERLEWQDPSSLIVGSGANSVTYSVAGNVNQFKRHFIVPSYSSISTSTDAITLNDASHESFVYESSDSGLVLGEIEVGEISIDETPATPGTYTVTISLTNGELRSAPAVVDIVVAAPVVEEEEEEEETPQPTQRVTFTPVYGEIGIDVSYINIESTMTGVTYTLTPTYEHVTYDFTPNSNGMGGVFTVRRNGASASRGYDFTVVGTKDGYIAGTHNITVRFAYARTNITSGGRYLDPNTYFQSIPHEVRNRVSSPENGAATRIQIRRVGETEWITGTVIRYQAHPSLPQRIRVDFGQNVALGTYEYRLHP